MKTVERILIKLVFIQFFFLIVTQLVFHQIGHFPEWNQLTKYEGVTKDNFTEVVETFQQR